MKVLSLSDKIVNSIFSAEVAAEFPDVEMVLGCGDLPYYYLEHVYEALKVPLFFVRGNHASPVEYHVNGERTGPFGGIDLHRQVVRHKGLLMAGFEGSLRYKTGPFMYTQGEMWWNVLSVVPALIYNQLAYGRYLDVLVTHASPWGIHDQPDRVHHGFKAFRWLLKVFQPAYHFHGHIHVYSDEMVTETQFEHTQVLNSYGYRITEIDVDELRSRKPKKQEKDDRASP
jgi:hypothetical protein